MKFNRTAFFKTLVFFFSMVLAGFLVTLASQVFGPVVVFGVILTLVMGYSFYLIYEYNVAMIDLNDSHDKYSKEKNV